MCKIFLGIELEYSDIYCKDAQNILEKIFDYSFTEWQNDFKASSKQNLNYLKWNLVTDNTIKNSDGGICSVYSIENNEIIPIKTRDDHILYTRGAEIVSPKTNDYKKLISQIKIINEEMLKNGAIIDRKLDDALHIHIDANNLSFEQIKQIPIKCLPIQSYLTKLLTFDGIEVPLYTKEDAELFIKCSSIDEMKEIYIAKEGNGQYSINHNLNRRIIDIGPWLRKDYPDKTIEFRAYSMSKNIKYIEECLYLSLDIYEYLINDKPLIDFEKRVDYIESIN